ncbi:hypothetical protein PtB15_5B478 [Puccinia triticina]|nr:hypothetical protein PtB15_5B478 [Puccinia triticina]
MAPTAYPPETWPTTYLQPQGPPRAPPSLAHRCSQEETLRSRLLTPSSKPPPPPPAPRREIPKKKKSAGDADAVHAPSPGGGRAQEPPRTNGPTNNPVPLAPPTTDTNAAENPETEAAPAGALWALADYICGSHPLG